MRLPIYAMAILASASVSAACWAKEQSFSKRSARVRVGCEDTRGTQIEYNAPPGQVSTVWKVTPRTSKPTRQRDQQAFWRRERSRAEPRAPAFRFWGTGLRGVLAAGVAGCK
jgi:hypothetical protein